MKGQQKTQQTFYGTDVPARRLFRWEQPFVMRGWRPHGRQVVVVRHIPLAVAVETLEQMKRVFDDTTCKVE